METCTCPPFAPTLLSFAKDSRLVCQQLLHSLWALLNRHPNEAAKTLSPRQNIPALCSRARLGVSPSFAPPPGAFHVVPQEVLHVDILALLYPRHNPCRNRGETLPGLVLFLPLVPFRAGHSPNWPLCFGVLAADRGISTTLGLPEV